MTEFRIDPFKEIRKNAHIWRGSRSFVWYQEALDDSFTVQILYDFGDTKRHIFILIHNKSQNVEFRNTELAAEKYQALKEEIEMVEHFLSNSKAK